jgi:altronate hydrolase
LKKWLQIDERDNVAVALSNLKPGEKIIFEGREILLNSGVKQKHKFVLSHLNSGESIIMYGVKVGIATVHLAPGDELNQDRIGPDKSHEIKWEEEYKWPIPKSMGESREWMGYLREDGQYGTRNHWLVIPLVFCENHHIEILRDSLEESLGFSSEKRRRFDISPLLKALRSGEDHETIKRIKPQTVTQFEREKRTFKNVDGLRFITHQTGCGGTRGDSDMFVELVISYLLNPNCAGATILSLGCQNAQLHQVKTRLSERAPKYNRPIVWCEEQAFEGEDAFLQTAVSETIAGLMLANQVSRERAPISALSLGLECGGSDGFSGITANPLLGKISDQIVFQGGKAILCEFPELSGVEQDLVKRCSSQKEANRFLELMKAYEKHAKSSGSSFDANPSPGNIREGLLTGAMKSAGAARKGGSAPIVSVLDYAEVPIQRGLHLLCTPGNDVESTTALAGSGANLIVFTTGLGTPTGNPLTPVVKVSSNTTLALKMPHLIDFDAGEIIGGKNMDELAEQFFSEILEVASGRETNAEKNGQNDFIPWKRDISL